MSLSHNNIPSRIDALDSVRGIAALIVVFWHCFNRMSDATHMQMGWLLLTPLRALINGEGAVIVFFVLSGFVLALPYFRPQPPNYTHFMLRRFCRIAIPYYVVIIAVVGVELFIEMPVRSDIGIWEEVKPENNVPVTVVLFLRHIFAFVLGAGQDTMLDGPAWSLVHEMRASALFPAMVLLMLRPRIGIPVMAVLYGAALWIMTQYGDFAHFPDDPRDVFSAYCVTIYLLPCFALGILLAAHRDRIMARLARLPDFVTMLLWMLLLGVFCYHDDYKIRQPLAMGAAALLIMLAQSPGLTAAVLTQSPLRWLGRISYSLYLVHAPIIFFMCQLWGGYLPPYIDVAVIIIAALLAATVMQRTIEVPAIRLGKRLTQR